MICREMSTDNLNHKIQVYENYVENKKCDPKKNAPNGLEFECAMHLYFYSYQRFYLFC